MTEVSSVEKKEAPDRYEVIDKGHAIHVYHISEVNRHLKLIVNYHLIAARFGVLTLHIEEVHEDSDDIACTKGYQYYCYCLNLPRERIVEVTILIDTEFDVKHIEERGDTKCEKNCDY